MVEHKPCLRRPFGACHNNGAMPRIVTILAFSWLWVIWFPGLGFGFDNRAKRLGLGLELGDPSGVTAKYYLNRNTALQGGVGFSGWPFGPGVHIDYLYEFRDAVNTRGQGFELPIYLGVGVKMGSWQYCRRSRVWPYDEVCTSSWLGGVRIPLGAALQLRQAPLEFQFEVAPVFAPYLFGFEGDVSLSVRFYF